MNTSACPYIHTYIHVLILTHMFTHMHVHIAKFINNHTSVNNVTFSLIVVFFLLYRGKEEIHREIELTEVVQSNKYYNGSISSSSV